jgi:hypothetical protein
MGSINNILSSSYLQSILNNALQGAASTTKTAANSVSGIASSSDNGQLSPFAQMMSTLQQLQQSDPAKYQQVTQQIATNLQSAAQTAGADGNATAANQLNQLAADFTSASKSGQLPNVQDLAKAIGGGHHHHHFHHAASDPDSNSSTTSGTTGVSGSASSSTSASQALSQLFSAVPADGTQNGSQSPMAIILNTLSNAGISVSKS